MFSFRKVGNEGGGEVDLIEKKGRGMEWIF